MTLGYVLAVFLMHESANVRETKVYPRVIDRGPGRAYSVRATTDLMNNAQIVSDGRSLTSANEHVNETESESTLKRTQTGTEKDENFSYHNGNSEPQGFGHIGFSVPDVYRASERFDKLGVKFVKKPDEGKMKGLAFIQDPDGYWIEILQANMLEKSS